MKIRILKLTLFVLLSVILTGAGYWYYSVRQTATDFEKKAFQAMKKGQYDVAFRFLKEAEKRGAKFSPEPGDEKTHAYILAAVGTQYLGEKKFSEAIQAFESAKSLYPEIDIDDELTLAYLMNGNKEKALEVINAAILAEPNEPRHYEYRGLVYFALGNKAKVKKDLRKVLELAPNYSSRSNIEKLLNSL